MSSALPAIVEFACLLGAVWLGIALRRILPERQLTTESQDAVKLAMGLVGTMAALILRAKGRRDAEGRHQSMSDRPTIPERSFGEGLSGLAPAIA